MNSDRGIIHSIYRTALAEATYIDALAESRGLCVDGIIPSVVCELVTRAGNLAGYTFLSYQRRNLWRGSGVACTNLTAHSFGICPVPGRRRDRGRGETGAP